MANTRTVVGQAVVAILQELPDHPSKTLARILTEREPKLFKSVESARTAIRNYRGNNGDISRKHNVGNGEFYRPPGKTTDQIEQLPAPLSEGEPWQIVPVDFKRALLIGDIHLPFHDRASLELALRYGRKLGVDCVILNGDVMDFYAVSFWEKDPRLRNFPNEIETGKRFLEVLRDSFPKAQIIYKEGNHEERLWRYAASRCPELFGLRDGSGREMFSLGTLLDCEEYGIQVVGNKQPLRCGEHLHVLHGHEFRAPFVNPVNPARGLYLRAKCNSICGDLHQTSQHTETGLTHVVSCWSHGMLCNPRPRYAPLNKWNAGFSTVSMYRNTWSLDNKKIIGGEVV